MTDQAVVKPVTEIKMNMIKEMPCGCRTIRATAVKIWYKVL